MLISYHLLILAALLAALGSIFINLLFFRGLRTARPPEPHDAPLVSILVPARNEERCIGECIRSLTGQDYPFFEVIVLDDQSTDNTATILRGLGVSQTGSISRLIRGRPVPEGWTGKNWACHQLAQAARGQYLLFVDADTTHEVGMLSALIAHARNTRADLLSAWPRLTTVTLGEQLVIPMILLLGFIHYPHWLTVTVQKWPGLVRSVPRKYLRLLGAANGQSLLFTRAAYDRIGGHEAVRNHLVEDVALGREVAGRIGEGMRLINCEALDFSRCRMYYSLPEVWSGFTKNLRAAFEGSLGGFLIAGGLQFCCYLLPFFFLLLGGGSPLVVLQVAAIYAARVVLTARFQTSWLGCFLHPAGHLLSLGIGLNSWVRSTTTGVTWKGRTYKVSLGDR